MIQTRRVFASFSVDDIGTANRFYSETLGVKAEMVSDEGPLFLHGPDGGATLVYLKADHAPAEFTVFNLSVENIESAVDTLTGLGVTFDRYEGFPTDERGIHRSGDHSIAWFKDPAGNGLSIVQEF